MHIFFYWNVSEIEKSWQDGLRGNLRPADWIIRASVVSE